MIDPIHHDHFFEERDMSNYRKFSGSSVKVTDSHLKDITINDTLGQRDGYYDNPLHAPSHHEGACMLQAPADCQEPETFALCEVTVQVCIDKLVFDSSLQPMSFREGVNACRSALQSLLPNPRRKAMEEAILSALDETGVAVSVQPHHFRKLVDAALGVKA